MTRHYNKSNCSEDHTNLFVRRIFPSVDDDDRGERDWVLQQEEEQEDFLFISFSDSFEDGNANSDCYNSIDGDHNEQLKYCHSNGIIMGKSPFHFIVAKSGNASRLMKVLLFFVLALFLCMLAALAQTGFKVY